MELHLPQWVSGSHAKRTESPVNERIKVGRWMCRDEWAAMTRTGHLQIDPSVGFTHVINTASPYDYRGSSSGTVFGTFDVDASLLIPASKPQWSRVVGPTVPLATNHLRRYPIRHMTYPETAADSADDMAWIAQQRFSLDPFEVWARHLLSRCQHAGLVVAWRDRTVGRDKNSVGFEIIGESMMGSVRGWESGEWAVDVADEAAPRSVINSYDPARSADDMIAKVIDRLRASGLPA